MSTAKGNVRKTGPPKHQNKTAFKNNLHDTSKKTKIINSIQVESCCSRCTEIIEWKIRYKKYKPLTTPKKCVKCQQKTVKQAYSMICSPCAETLQLCAKCGKQEEVVHKPGLSATEEAARDSELQQELKALPERKRRAFYRKQEKGDTAGPSTSGPESDENDEKLLTADEPEDSELDCGNLCRDSEENNEENERDTVLTDNIQSISVSDQLETAENTEIKLANVPKEINPDLVKS